jgi:FCD domain
VARLCEAEERPALRELADTWLIPAEDRVNHPLPVGQMDEEFHATLVRAVGNSEMTRVHADITERIRIIRRLDFIKPARIDVTYDEHARIIRALSACCAPTSSKANSRCGTSRSTCCTRRGSGWRRGKAESAGAPLPQAEVEWMLSSLSRPSTRRSRGSMVSVQPRPSKR